MGTLSWNVTQSGGACGFEGQSSYQQWNYSNFQYQYTVGNVTNTQPLSGSAVYFNSPGGYCPPNGGITTGFGPVNDNQANVYTLNFTSENGGNGSVSSTQTGYGGFVNPKYVVVGVTYAPPGSSSYVQYGNTTMIGNTTKISNSFSSGVGTSVSTYHHIKGWVSGVDGSAGVTAYSDTNYTQEQNSSDTITIQKSVTVSYTTHGTPNFSPVNSDYDYVWIWLNPVLPFTYTQPAGSNPASMQWRGYGYDPNDPAGTQGLDLFEVQVGCLNGDFACPSALTWANGTQSPSSYVSSGTLSRAWASGQSWPSGEMPNLTFYDVCAILTFDPLAATPSQCPVQNNYQGFAGMPQTTPDQRFTQDPFNPPNPINYPVGGGAILYSPVQINTQSIAQGTSQTFQQAFGVEESFGGSIFGIGLSTTLKQSYTLQWVNSWMNTLTTQITLTNSLSVTGPPEPPPSYTGPDEFIAYQDNIYGTFVFVPVQN